MTKTTDTTAKLSVRAHGSGRDAEPDLPINKPPFPPRPEENK